jgi:hypothetical protein
MSTEFITIKYQNEEGEIKEASFSKKQIDKYDPIKADVNSGKVLSFESFDKFLYLIENEFHLLTSLDPNAIAFLDYAGYKNLNSVEYSDIYNREKEYVNLVGFEHLTNLSELPDVLPQRCTAQIKKRNENSEPIILDENREKTYGGVKVENQNVNSLAAEENSERSFVPFTSKPNTYVDLINQTRNFHDIDDEFNEIMNENNRSRSGSPARSQSPENNRSRSGSPARSFTGNILLDQSQNETIFTNESLTEKVDDFNTSAHFVLRTLTEILNDVPNIDKVVIAGGFTLMSYKNDTYRKVSDIDLFFHSIFDENEITELMLNIIKCLYENSDDFCVKEIGNAFEITGLFKRTNTSYKIQIIKRLYTSPSQIIHGFDVDSCCILYDLKSRQYYCTERFEYAFKNLKNTVNFDRMSPSYEHRLVKYMTRGFGLDIPGIDVFMDRFSFDFSNPVQGADIIRKFLFYKSTVQVHHEYFQRWDGRILDENNISDYIDYSLKSERIRIDSLNDINDTLFDVTKFTTLDPQLQAMGSFHRTVYEDPEIWYGKDRDFYVPSHSNSEEIVEIYKEQISDKKYLNCLKYKCSKMKVTSFMNRFLKKFDGRVVMSGNSFDIFTGLFGNNFANKFYIQNTDKWEDDFLSINNMYTYFLSTVLVPELLGFDPCEEFREYGFEKADMILDPIINQEEIYDFKRCLSGADEFVSFVMGHSYEQETVNDNIMNLMDNIINDADYDENEFNNSVHKKLTKASALKVRINGRLPRISVSGKRFNTYDDIFNNNDNIIILCPSDHHPDGKFYVKEKNRETVLNSVFSNNGTRHIKSQGFIIDDAMREMEINNIRNTFF